MQKLRNLYLKFPGLGLKTVAYTVLPIYWVALLAATFLH